MMNNIFNLNRFFHLMKRFYVLNIKGIAIALAAVEGAIAIIGVLTSIGHGHGINQQAFIVLNYVALFIGGFFLTSSIFNELHKPDTSIQFLTLPASTFEKVLAGWLNSGLIFTVVAMLTFYVGYYVSSALAFVTTQTPFEAINLFEADFLKIALIYLLINPLFLLAAVYFKGHNFMKLILALFVISMVNSIYQMFVVGAVYGEMFFNFGPSTFENMGPETGIVDYLQEIILPTIKFIAYYILPPFFLVVTYIRFTEREV